MTTRKVDDPAQAVKTTYSKDDPEKDRDSKGLPPEPDPGPFGPAGRPGPDAKPSHPGFAPLSPADPNERRPAGDPNSPPKPSAAEQPTPQPEAKKQSMERVVLIRDYVPSNAESNESGTLLKMKAGESLTLPRKEARRIIAAGVARPDLDDDEVDE